MSGKYDKLSHDRTLRLFTGTFDAAGAILSAVCIVLCVGLLVSLLRWAAQDLSASLVDLINTALSVALHPVGDAVIRLH